MLQVGLKGKKTVVVTTENTAERMLSGLLPVYATPSLIAFMEYTCSETVRPFLDAGMSTVGTLVNIKHTSASPVGSTIHVNVNSYKSMGASSFSTSLRMMISAPSEKAFMNVSL